MVQSVKWLATSWRNRGSILGKERKISVFLKDRTDSVTHTAFYLVDSGAPLLGGSGRDLSISGDIQNLTPLCVFRERTGTNLLFDVITSLVSL
jgi:hypothetical protein